MQIIEGESLERRKLIVIPATACALVFSFAFYLLWTYFFQFIFYFYMRLFEQNVKWFCDSILSRFEFCAYQIGYVCSLTAIKEFYSNENIIIWVNDRYEI